MAEVSKPKKSSLRSEFLKTMTGLATAGFGVVAALAWNEAIKSFIDHFIQAGAGFRSKFYYAIIVTALAVFVTYYLGKSTQKAMEKEEKNKDK